MLEKIKETISAALKELNLATADFSVEHPDDMEKGDYATNVALILAKKTGRDPLSLARDIAKIMEGKLLKKDVEKIEAVSPGFINFFLSANFFQKAIKEIIENPKYGQNNNLKSKKIIIEFTDPNPFKEFHIGHLMSNTIGECFARVMEWHGAHIKRACYQGDLGLHVSKAVYGMLKFKNKTPLASDNLKEKVKFLGSCYREGVVDYEVDKKGEIENINRELYEGLPGDTRKLYELGKKWSLEYFGEIYDRLGTKFDFNFFESEVGDFGKHVVEIFLEKKFFQKSEGAVIFPGELYGLHTRVFINKLGLPTYEAKELGLAKVKYDAFAYDQSIVITSNEINEYFKVLKKAMEITFPDLASKTVHISHGMMRLPTGKMSSRTGEVISAEYLIDEMKKLILAKIEDRNFDAREKDEIAEAVALGAVKYSILRQAPSRDIIFDFEKSISFEGDSGPYIQYAHTRAKAVLSKAKESNLTLDATYPKGWERARIERLLYRFPEVVNRAYDQLSPQHIATFLMGLAHEFNNFYAIEKIVDPNDAATPFKVALTSAVARVLENGLHLLGIKAPKKM